MASSSEVKVGQVWTIRKGGVDVPVKVMQARKRAGRGLDLTLKNMRTGRILKRTSSALRQLVQHDAVERRPRRNFPVPAPSIVPLPAVSVPPGRRDPSGRVRGRNPSHYPSALVQAVCQHLSRLPGHVARDPELILEEVESALRRVLDGRYGLGY